jgi:hypothetical protein
MAAAVPPKSFGDVFSGGDFGSMPSGKVYALDGGRPRLVGTFKSLAAEELEIDLGNGFIMRLILQDYDPDTNLAICDMYVAEPSRDWKSERFISSGRAYLPVGAAPVTGIIQQWWKNWPNGMPGSTISLPDKGRFQPLLFTP